MLRITADAKPGDPALEQEVDEALVHFNDWYKNIQQVTDPDTGARVPVGMNAFESAAIKTFLGYYLGVGGHYAPPEEKKDAQENRG